MREEKSSETRGGREDGGRARHRGAGDGRIRDRKGKEKEEGGKERWREGGRKREKSAYHCQLESCSTQDVPQLKQKTCTLEHRVHVHVHVCTYSLTTAGRVSWPDQSQARTVETFPKYQIHSVELEGV